jgi:hypothetical protein
MQSPLADFDDLALREKETVMAFVRTGCSLLTSSELVQKTGFNQRNLNDILGRLKAIGVVESRIEEKELADRKLPIQAWRLTSRFLESQKERFRIRALKYLIEPPGAGMDEEGDSWERFQKNFGPSTDTPCHDPNSTAGC